MLKQSWGIFIGIVLVECIVLLMIGRSLYKKNSFSFLSRSVHIVPLDQQYVVFPKDSKLRYYNELKSNTDKIEDLSSMGIPQTVIHTINSDGLNDRYEYSIPAPPGTFRILSLGDSFTEGAFVSTNQNYSELLEDMLNQKFSCPSVTKFEVINLGVEGYDMQYNLERLKRKGLKYKPDVIILWTNDNDYNVPSEKLRAFGSAWHSAKEVPKILEYFKLKGDYDPILTVMINKFYTLFPVEDLIREEMLYLREFIRLYTGPLLIFSINNLPSSIVSQIQEVVRTHSDVHFYPDIPSDFATLPDFHPSPEGHRQFAEFLFQKLISTSMLPCGKH